MSARQARAAGTTGEGGTRGIPLRKQFFSDFLRNFYRLNIFTYANQNCACGSNSLGGFFIFYYIIKNKAGRGYFCNLCLYSHYIRVKRGSFVVNILMRYHKKEAFRNTFFD